MAFHALLHSLQALLRAGEIAGLHGLGKSLEILLRAILGRRRIGGVTDEIELVLMRRPQQNIVRIKLNAIS